VRMLAEPDDAFGLGDCRASALPKPVRPSKGPKDHLPARVKPSRIWLGMNVVLPPDLEQYVKTLVGTGGYAESSEIIEESLRQHQLSRPTHSNYHSIKGVKP
jgi:hypothetical protein